MKLMLNQLTAEQAFDQLRDHVQKEMEELPDTLTLEQAAEYAGKWSFSLRYYTNAVHLELWKHAILASKVKAGASYGSKTELLKDYAEAFGLSYTTLGYYIAVAVKMGYNIILFDKWLRAGGYRKRQYHVKRLSQAREDPSVLGPEGLAELVRYEVQTGVEALEQVTDPEEKEGLRAAYQETADAFMERGAPRLEESVDPDTGEVEEVWMHHEYDIPAAFFTLVVSQPCMACGKPGPSDPHHVDSGLGTALKGSDWTIVPLCRRCHTTLETVGPTKFTQETGLNPWYAVARMLHLWVSGEDLPISS